MTDRTPPRRTPWPEGQTHPLGHPIQPSVVYTAEDPDALDRVYEGLSNGDAGFVYAREGHPNAVALSRRIDTMEGAVRGLVTGSGMAAVTAAVMACVKAGDHVVGGDQLYGRSLRLIDRELPRLGVATSRADQTDAEAVKAVLRPETRMVLIETVSNPTLRVADLTGIAALCRDRGILLAVDSTFTTPRGIRPFEHGAHIVIHSVTKLLSGHSDATLGWVAAADRALNDEIDGMIQTLGLTASPFDCWLAERGMMSFDLRYERASENAVALADRLSRMVGVRRVIHPARDDHPDRARAAALFGDRQGNMLAFEVAPTRAAANALVRAVGDRVAFAPTLGDIATTLSHPASSSHRALDDAGRAALGISEGFFRVSVGCEGIGPLTDAFEAGAKAADAA